MPAPDDWQAAQLSKHFLQAAEEGEVAVVARLLRQGVDVNAKDDVEMSERYVAGYTAGKSALIRAAQQVSGWLLALGALMRLRSVVGLSFTGTGGRRRFGFRGRRGWRGLA